MTEQEKKHLIALLDSLISERVPGATRVSKYGGTLYTLKPNEKEGQFCGVFAYKAHVQLSLANGSSLHDPNGLLEGRGKYRRHLSFRSLDDVDEKVIRQFILAASTMDAE